MADYDKERMMLRQLYITLRYYAARGNSRRAKDAIRLYSQMGYDIEEMLEYWPTLKDFCEERNIVLSK